MIRIWTPASYVSQCHVLIFCQHVYLCIYYWYCHVKCDFEMPYVFSQHLHMFFNVMCSILSACFCFDVIFNIFIVPLNVFDTIV